MEGINILIMGHVYGLGEGGRGGETGDTFQLQQKPKTMVGATKIFDTIKTMKQMFINEAQVN
jgi:hypothetical protein